MILLLSFIIFIQVPQWRCASGTTWQLCHKQWQCQVAAGGLHDAIFAPKEPLDADAQAEADGGDDEAPPDDESDDHRRRWQRRRGLAGSSPQFSWRVLSPLLSGQPGSQDPGAQVEGGKHWPGRLPLAPLPVPLPLALKFSKVGSLPVIMALMRFNFEVLKGSEKFTGFRNYIFST